MLRFADAALQVDPLFRCAEPPGALNLMVCPRGDKLGWHFDNADCVVTLLLQGAPGGDVFE